MQICLATSDDIPQLCDLLCLLFAQEAEFTPDREAQVRGLARVIEGKGVGDIVVARQRGQIVGMVNLLYTVSTALGEPVALLEDMVVTLEARGQGVGRQLLDHACDLARERGVRRITLLTDDDNAGAHRFYQRAGFERSTMVPFRKALA